MGMSVYVSMSVCASVCLGLDYDFIKVQNL